MISDPVWTKCPHLSAGTCLHPELVAAAMGGGQSPRPELSQDLALHKLAEACQTCPISPQREE